MHTFDASDARKRNSEACLPNLKMEITSYSIRKRLTSNFCQAMSGVMQRGFLGPHPKFPPHTISLVVTSLRFALISNYVSWMFLLPVVSPAHALGCKEKKYGDGTS